jgi:hypothetical protein
MHSASSRSESAGWSTGTEAEYSPPIFRQRQHRAASFTSSEPSSYGPLTPPTSLKRKLSDEIAIHTEIDISPPAKMLKMIQAKEEAKAKGVVRSIGLVALGMVVGSVGTVVGLMQLAD